MPALDLLLTTAGALVALAGLGLLAWALAGDRLANRALRRRGGLRRCPRCWYDMRATEGLTCPECGRAARRERALLRTRRRWRAGVVGLLVLAIGVGVGISPRGKAGAWHLWVPDTAVILAMQFAPDPGWTVDELARRAWGKAGVPHVEHPRRFAGWQLDLLTDACVRVVRSPDLQKHHYTAWSMLTRLCPEPQAAAPIAIENLSSPGPMHYAATRFFVWRAADLPVRDLESACDALEASVAGAIPGPAVEGVRAVVPCLRAAIAARSDEEHQRHLAAVVQLNLDPHVIAAELSQCAPDELAALYRRLGLSHPAPMTLQRTIAIAATAIEINDDDTPDCMLEIGPIYGHERDRLFFVRRGQGWRLVGRIEQGSMGVDAAVHSLAAPDGTRFLRLRHTDLARAGANFPCDAWLRVRSGRLRPVQFLMVAGSAPGSLERTLVSTEPRLVRAGGRWHALYQFGARAEFRVYERAGPGRSVVVAEEAGEFLFPLDAAPSAFGSPRDGGPWEGRRPGWILGPDEALYVRHYFPRLLEIARSDDEPARAELAHILSFISDDSPELTALYDALEEP